jgi:DNA-binding IclR family transcriptional regulator
MTMQPTLIQSVVRALDLLDLVGSADAPVTAKRLSRLTGLPLGTTYNLLRTLVHEGYLVRDPDGYLLGDHAGRLGRADGSGVGRSRGRQILRTVHADLHAAAYWAEFADGAVRIIDIVDSPDAPRTDLWVGLQDAAHATALGKAVLSALPTDQRRQYLSDHRLVDLTPRTHTDRIRLESELDATGAVSVDREEYSLGTACVAVPVRSRWRTGAVAISVPAVRLPSLTGRLAALTRAARLLELADSA